MSTLTFYHPLGGRQLLAVVRHRRRRRILARHRDAAAAAGCHFDACRLLRLCLRGQLSTCVASAGRRHAACTIKRGNDEFVIIYIVTVFFFFPNGIWVIRFAKKKTTTTTTTTLIGAMITANITRGRAKRVGCRVATTTRIIKRSAERYFTRFRN